jgi:hypothetical protein
MALPLKQWLTVCSSGARLTAGVMMSGMIFQLFCLVG